MSSEIIYPPPDVKSMFRSLVIHENFVGVIDKTAEFVAKVGDEFEKKVSAQQAGQAKFAFLNHSHPYRKYYELRIKELREGVELSQPAVPQALLDYKQQQEEKRKKREERKMLADGMVKEYPPPPPNVFVIDHPIIAPVDDDIIKITAQFAVRNGQKFLDGLLSREGRNPQFEFIKPEHHLYEYFTALMESYKKVLLLPPDIKEKLEKLASDRQFVLNRINDRYMYLKQEAKRAEDKAKAEVELTERMNRLDWYNFTIVDTLDFPIDDSVKLGVPIDPRTGHFFTTGGHIPTLAGDDILEAGLEEEIEMEEPSPPGLTEEPSPVSLPESNVPIRTDYVRQPKSGRVTATETLIKSPITGEMIPESQMAQHMRVVLIDPKWKHQSDIVMKRAREAGSAYADDIADNITEFVKRRPDIFGTVEDEVRGVIKSTTPSASSGPSQPVIGPSMPSPPEEKSPKKSRKD